MFLPMENYAIIKSGGKQFRVTSGSRVLVEKLEVPVGQTIEINDVLLVRSDKGTQIGRPTVSGASVTAEVLAQDRAPKVLVFKKRSKKGYKKMLGHRQFETELLVKDIRA
jgi:large subunit ribosomal protein L21